jgi:hypothetical protein
LSPPVLPDWLNPRLVCFVEGEVTVFFPAKEGFVMDPHFNEYLAAVAGMHELYGEPACESGTEFHEEQAESVVAEAMPTVAVA